MAMWISAKAAFAHVLAHEILPDVTTEKLNRAIKRGEIPARAEVLTWDDKVSHGTLVPRDFWSKAGASIHVQIDFSTGTASSVWHSIVGGADPWSKRSASGIEFSARHLFAIWPATERTSIVADSGSAKSKKRGPKPKTLERVKMEMRAFDRTILSEMTEVAMEAQFDASRDTCRRAWREVSAEN